ncbi:hypothetical protein LZ30DRAFT_255070 [Colletotrichum cereale]|nr:hypothetical protein LZ30DRAFT_255070 [Colletotrichum cereale]
MSVPTRRPSSAPSPILSLTKSTFSSTILIGRQSTARKNTRMLGGAAPCCYFSDSPLSSLTITVILAPALDTTLVADPTPAAVCSTGRQTAQRDSCPQLSGETQSSLPARQVSRARVGCAGHGGDQDDRAEKEDTGPLR